MEFYIQLGYGMMRMVNELLEFWDNCSVILSPRDLNEDQIIRLAENINNYDGRVLIDPQFFLPRADHPRLVAHSYWPRDYDTDGFSDSNRNSMISSLVELNNSAQSSVLIAPGERANEISDIWIHSQMELLECCKSMSDLPVYQTLCLSSDVITSNQQIAFLIQELSNNIADGYYLIAEHPNGEYLVTNPVWISNLLDLAISLQKMGGKVIVGYSNQQQLILSCGNIHGIASGNWMNVRSFPLEKFLSGYSELIKRRGVWYYHPQTYSEINLPSLDIAVRLGFRDQMIANPGSEFSDILFSIPQPSASGWNEPFAFRHYLDVMMQQVNQSVLGTYQLTLENYQRRLVEAEDLLNVLRARGITGKGRDFLSCVIPQRAALAVLESTHGSYLRRDW